MENTTELSETYINYKLEPINESTIRLQYPDHPGKDDWGWTIHLNRIRRFRVISEDKGWRLEITEGTGKSENLIAIRTRNHEIGSRDVFQAWLDSPKKYAPNPIGRPTSRRIHAWVRSEDKVTFAWGGDRGAKTYSLDQLAELTLNGSPLGTAGGFVWRVQIGPTGRANSFYVSDPFEVYRELREMQELSR